MLSLMAEQSRFRLASVEILFMGGAVGLLGGWMLEGEEIA